MTRFVRSLREGDFPLYARWLLVHVRGMIPLAQQNPEVHAEFMKGNSVVQSLVGSSVWWPKTKPMSSQIISSGRKTEQLHFIEPRGTYDVHSSRA